VVLKISPYFFLQGGARHDDISNDFKFDLVVETQTRLLVLFND
jgi:hypothetical protein